MEGQDVLHRLLAEKVVDADDARFIEDLVQFAVQADRAGQVGVKGLKHSSSARRVAGASSGFSHYQANQARRRDRSAGALGLTAVNVMCCIAT